MKRKKEEGNYPCSQPCLFTVMATLKRRMVVGKKMGSSNDKDAYDTKMSGPLLILSTVFSDHWCSCSHHHTKGRVRVTRVRSLLKGCVVMLRSISLENPWPSLLRTPCLSVVSQLQGLVLGSWFPWRAFVI